MEVFPDLTESDSSLFMKAAGDRRSHLVLDVFDYIKEQPEWKAAELDPRPRVIRGVPDDSTKGDAKKAAKAALEAWRAKVAAKDLVNKMVSALAPRPALWPES